MRDWLRYFHLWPEPHIWLLQLLAIALATALLGWALARLLRRLTRIESGHPSLWRGALLYASTLPVLLLTGIAGLTAAAGLLQNLRPGPGWAHWPAVLRVLVVLVGALFLMRLVRKLTQGATNAQLMAHPMDAESALAMGKLGQVTVVALAALMVLEALGFSISGVLAFGGVGGIAIGFAAKDTLSNFFGGLMIFLDKPFSVGNWVRSPDAQIEGTVEDIGWRLTRIRNFQERPLYIPNALFNTIVVENVSRMQHFRIMQTLGLTYDDYARVRPICNDLRSMLQQHPDIAQDQTLLVRFQKYGASTLDILVYCYAKTTDWDRFMQVQEDVLIKMGDIVQQHGASFAFPTTTTYNIDAGSAAAPPSTTTGAATAPPASK
ncbi:mechanosensitive ion channel family protein [Ottowia sp.]|uniref:mechanosensitive ion channel family protein n=1 Tax=Ottowia sp. TaxID=1898956 RepID=UPI003A85AE3E